MNHEEIKRLKELHAHAKSDVIMVSAEDADLLRRAIEELARTSPDVLTFTVDLRTRMIVLRAVARLTESLLEQATDMHVRKLYEASSGGADDVPTTEMARLEQSFKNAYARLLELVTTFPRKTT